MTLSSSRAPTVTATEYADDSGFASKGDSLPFGAGRRKPFALRVVVTVTRSSDLLLGKEKGERARCTR